MRSLLTLFAAAALAAPAVAQTVTEPSSRVPFPVELNTPNDTRHALIGTGLRTRTVLNVKVYAFGLYVEPAGARTALAAYAGKTPQDLERDASLYQALLRMSVPMSLRLVMTRNVGGDQMSEAFDGALRPRVQSVQSTMPGGEEALNTFRGFFSVERLTEGAELVFTCTPDGNLHSAVSGERKPAISSRALCWALFDVYLGNNPISPNGKKSAVHRLPDVLAGR